MPLPLSETMRRPRRSSPVLGAHMILTPISLTCGRFRGRTGCISLTCGSCSPVCGFLPLQFQRLEADYCRASATRKRNRSRQTMESATRKRDTREIRKAEDETAPPNADPTFQKPLNRGQTSHKTPRAPKHRTNRALLRLFMADYTISKSLLRLFVAPKTRYAGYEGWNSNPHTRHIRKPMPQTSHLAHFLGRVILNPNIFKSESTEPELRSIIAHSL